MKRRDTFEKRIDRVLERLPEEYSGRLKNLVFIVEDWADAETLEQFGFDEPEELLGFFDGTPLTERTHDQLDFGPDRIFLFRRAIEEEARFSGLPLQRVVRETVWHEIAHYFGFSEEEMDRIEALWSEGA